jgi:spore coat polysaccharide biosynthesis protein SpsF
MKDLGVIIQARTGSTRLPGKLINSFFDGKSVLELIIERFLMSDSHIPIILATTTNVEDDIICRIASKYSIKLFRGSENDVLARFIESSLFYNIKKIIRVCADNPFYDVSGTLELVKNIDLDTNYISYSVGEKIPSITSHFGFWGEITTLSTLIQINSDTKSLYHHEHVTSFIYSNPEIFKIKLIPYPDSFTSRNDLRFTLDTQSDFELYKIIYENVIGKANKIDLPTLVNHVSNNQQYLDIMKQQIKFNSK